MSLELQKAKINCTRKTQSRKLSLYKKISNGDSSLLVIWAEKGSSCSCLILDVSISLIMSLSSSGYLVSR